MNARSKFAAFLLFSILAFSVAWTASPPPLVAQDVIVSQAIPDNAPQGMVSLNVQVKGNGFKKGAIAKWLVTGSETDTGGVTVNSTTYVSTTELRANITVAADAQTEKKFDIKVMLTNGRTGKGIELFSVIVNPPDPAIAYVGSGDSSLWVMNADGTNQMPIIEAPRNSGVTFHQPNWAPDSSQLVFASNIQGGGVYLINRDGSELRKVIAVNDGYFADPVWSPVPFADGQYKILFRDQFVSGGPGDLFMVNLDGTGLMNLTNTSGYDEFYPTWNPSATSFAAQVYVYIPATPTVSDLVLCDLNPDGSLAGQTNLTEAGALTDAYVYSPDWANAQDKIVLNARLSNDLNNSDLWVIDLADHANPVRLTQTSGANEISPSWSADDSRIVFRRNAPAKSKLKSGIFVMNADGSAVTGDGYPTDGIQPDWRRCCPTCATMCAP